MGGSLLACLSYLLSASNMATDVSSCATNSEMKNIIGAGSLLALCATERVTLALCIMMRRSPPACMKRAGSIARRRKAPLLCLCAEASASTFRTFADGTSRHTCVTLFTPRLMRQSDGLSRKKERAEHVLPLARDEPPFCLNEDRLPAVL